MNTRSLCFGGNLFLPVTLGGFGYLMGVGVGRRCFLLLLGIWLFHVCRIWYGVL